MNAMLLLSLQLDWGADEALGPDPVSRLLSRAAEPADAPAARLLSPRVDASVTAVAAAQPAVPAMPPVPLTPAAPVQPRAVAGLPARGPAVEARALSEAAADLDALRAVIAGFNGCSLRDTATRSVLPTGDPAGGIAIVGEVPDEDEDRAGHPFAGRAGDLLDRMLGSIGVRRQDCLLLPLIPWRPPGSRAPSPIELTMCQPFLERALRLAAPSIVLCMGSRPARTVAASTIRAGVGWRAPVLSGLPDGARTLAMRHPSYLLSHLPARRDAWGDLIRVRRALDERSRAAITDT